MLIPHSPALAEDGKDQPEYRLRYLSQMNDWRDSTREQAYMAYKNSPEYGNIDKYQRYLEGNQWDTRRAKYKSKYVNNKMDLMRRQRLALLSDARPVVDVMSNVLDFDDTASVLNNVLICEWQRQNSADTLMDVVDIAMLHGTAFLREGAASPGYMTSLALGPDNVMPIQPSLRSIQDSTAVLYRTWKPISYFKKLFPLNSEGLEKQARYIDAKMGDGFNRPGHIPEYTWNQMSVQFRKLVGVKQMPDITTGRHGYGSLELEEYYYDDMSINESSRVIIIKDPFLPQSMHNWWYEVKPGERLYPRKRLVIYGGTRLLYDGPSPFWHGMYPFIDLKLNPVPWSYYGLSTYRPLITVQDAINEIPAGVLDLTKRALNPTIITKMNVASEAAWREYLSDMPGARLKVNNNVIIGNDIKYGELPQLPPYVGENYTIQLDQFDKLSGIVDVASLTKKEQMPSGDTLNDMKDALQTPLRREERKIESFLQNAGQQKISNIIQFYTAKQRMKMLGDDGLTWEDFLLDPGKLHPSEETAGSLESERKRSFWKQFSLVIKPGSLKSGAKDKEKMEAVALAARGMMSKQMAMRKSGMSEKDIKQNIEELMQEAMIQGGQGGGQGAPGESRTPRTVDEKNGPSAPMG